VFVSQSPWMGEGFGERVRARWNVRFVLPISARIYAMLYLEPIGHRDVSFSPARPLPPAPSSCENKRAVRSLTVAARLLCPLPDGLCCKYHLLPDPLRLCAFARTPLSARSHFQKKFLRLTAQDSGFRNQNSGFRIQNYCSDERGAAADEPRSCRSRSCWR
jgi:hypothetical protein